MFTNIETALVDVLKAALADVHILTADELSDIEEGRQPTPAVHVIYNGYRVVGDRPDKTAAQVAMTWLTVVAVRNVRDRRGGSDSRQDAVALTEKIAGKLLGHHVTGSVGPLALTNAPAPAGNNGFLYVPLAWSVETILKRADLSTERS